MTIKNIVYLILLAALWGASFLFMRIGVEELRPAPMIMIRLLIAAAFLVPVLAIKQGARGFSNMFAQYKYMLIVGFINSALPFALFAYAELTLSASFTSVITATTPLWGALIAVLWFKHRLGKQQSIGLALSFVGVVFLVWHRLKLSGDALHHAAEPVALAILASLTAALMYGIGSHYTKRYLSEVPPLQIATGSMIGGAITLVPLAWIQWPAAAVSWQTWSAVITMGIACTGLAYIFYFELIASAGTAHAVSVTFLVPFFGIIWGTLFLDETISFNTIVGGLIILIGIALSAGLLKRRRVRHP